MTKILNLSTSPSASGHAAHVGRREEPAEARRGTVAETGQMVFVVDDDAMMGSLIGATLQAAGYREHAFTDGTEAATLAATVPPDLLLVDLTMPQLSGAETMARLRKLQPTLPVLVISGLSQEEARAAAPEANGFLEKPFKFEALLRAVASLRAC